MANARSLDAEFEQFLMRYRKLNQEARRKRFESDTALIMGVLSSSLAITALIVLSSKFSAVLSSVDSFACDRMASSGLILGGIGLAFSWRHQKLSWLSAFGFALSVVTQVTIPAIVAQR